MYLQNEKSAQLDLLEQRIEDAVQAGDVNDLRSAQFELYNLGQTSQLAPLSPQRHDHLRSIYRHFPGSSDLGGGFDEFVLSLARSERLFDEDGRLQPVVREAIQVAMRFWMAHRCEREELEINIAKNFGVHPLHMGAVRDFLDQCIARQIETMVGRSRWVLRVVDDQRMSAPETTDEPVFEEEIETPAFARPSFA